MIEVVEDNQDDQKQPPDPKIETRGLKTYNKLKPKQKQFVNNYVDPKSKTQGNGTQSYAAVHNTAGMNTAAVSASRALSNDNIQQSIAELMESMGMGVRVRLNQTNSIIRQTDKVETIQEHFDADDNLTHKTVSTRDVSPQDRLKAINLANKMEGMYDKNRETAKIVGREVRSLMSRFKPGSDK